MLEWDEKYVEDYVKEPDILYGIPNMTHMIFLRIKWPFTKLIEIEQQGSEWLRTFNRFTSWNLRGGGGGRGGGIPTKQNFQNLVFTSNGSAHMHMYKDPFFLFKIGSEQL
jgi:hypothetical protein